MTHYILYSTLGCHLCEQAEALIWPFLSPLGAKLEIVDIADSEELTRLYGVTIPVLKNPDTGSELNWPFGDKELNSFFSS